MWLYEDGHCLFVYDLKQNQNHLNESIPVISVYLVNQPYYWKQEYFFRFDNNRMKLNANERKTKD